MFSYCCLHIHSGPLYRTITTATHILLRPLRSIQSSRNSIENIRENNCLAEGNFGMGYVIRNNFVIVVAKTQSEGITCSNLLLSSLTRIIPSRMPINLSRPNFLFTTSDASCNFHFLALRRIL